MVMATHAWEVSLLMFVFVRLLVGNLILQIIKNAWKVLFLFYYFLGLAFSVRTLQTPHMYSTLKRRGNECFHVISTWNTRVVFVGNIHVQI